MATRKERVDTHDRKRAGSGKLRLPWMRMGATTPRELHELQVESRREHAEIRKERKALAASQRRTDGMRQDFMAALRRGGNGHGKGFAL